MPIDAPLPKDTRSQLADWLEIEVLARQRGVAARGDLLRLYDGILDDDHEPGVDKATGEMLEGEILEDDRSQYADHVFDEINHRATVLKADYPFTIDTKGMNWCIRAEQECEDARIEAARTCYRFCLLVSAIRDKRINGGALADHLSRSIAEHFQAIATDAAAVLINGEAISFGWPRSNGSGFRDALKNASQQMRLGEPLESVPTWSKGREKDAGIDVIAWRDFRDGRPAKIVLLGRSHPAMIGVKKASRMRPADFLIGSASGRRNISCRQFSYRFRSIMITSRTRMQHSTRWRKTKPGIWNGNLASLSIA